jgi:monoamine oxidase
MTRVLFMEEMQRLNILVQVYCVVSSIRHVNGAQAEKFSAAGKDQVIQAILQELDTAFDGKATVNVRRDEVGNVINEYFDWTKEPYIQGGISYVSPNGSIEDRTVLAQPMNESIFFAGEATDSSGESGTINGALLSAERAAQEVVVSILSS